MTKDNNNVLSPEQAIDRIWELAKKIADRRREREDNIEALREVYECRWQQTLSFPIPDDWIYIYDDKKGYGFSLPAGSEGENLTIDGVDVFSATTPRPSEVDIFVLAYKDQTRSKVELLDDAVTFLEELGQDVTPGELTAQSDQFAVANATTIHPSRGKGRLRILVGTDITDNYVMIIGVEDERFAANEKIIDMIWGSFEIWSGGGVSG